MTDLYHTRLWAGSPPVVPSILEGILDGCVEHRPWFQDNVWNGGPAVRRAHASKYLSGAYIDGKVWEVWREDTLCGIFILNQVRLGLDAQGHFIFFDRVLVNKKTLCLTMMNKVFADEQLDLHAIRVDLPVYAGRLAGFLRKALFFKYEAERRLPTKEAKVASRRHQAAYYNGRWQDVLLLSITKDEFHHEWTQHQQIGRKHSSDAGTVERRDVVSTGDSTESSGGQGLLDTPEPVARGSKPTVYAGPELERRAWTGRS